jgi:hypothetical protein
MGPPMAIPQGSFRHLSARRRAGFRRSPSVAMMRAALDAAVVALSEAGSTSSVRNASAIASRRYSCGASPQKPMPYDARCASSPTQDFPDERTTRR